MDYRSVFVNSLGYTKETLFGKWRRWGIFVLCALPGLLAVILCETFCAELPAVILSLLVSPVLYLIIMGYIARIYRGTTPLPEVPEFDNGGSLFVDGFRITVTYILWFLPAFLLFLALGGLTLALCVAEQIDAFIALLYILLTPLLLVAVAIAVLYSDFGAIRCARTNSILEGINISSITMTIKAIGWVNYLIAIVILIVPFLVITTTLAFALDFIPVPVPYVFDIIDGCVITPIYLVFTARYMTLLYNQGTPQQTPTL